MILLDTLMGVLCAMGVFGVMVQVGLVANWYILEQNASKPLLPRLEEEPDGVEAKICRPDGTHIHAYHRGSGPAVLLIPDLGKRSKSLNQLWRYFAEYGYKVITFEWGGHAGTELPAGGLTPKTLLKDLDRVVHHYGLQDALLVGHSRGAQVMLHYLTQYKQEKQVARAWISLGAPAYGTKRKGLLWPWHQQVLSLPRIDSLLKTRLFGWGYAAHSFGDRPTPQQLKTYIKSLEFQRPTGFADSYIRFSQLTPGLQVSLPGLVLHGKADQQTPALHARKLSATLPQAACNIIPAPIGHMMIWEHAKPLVEYIREFERSL